MNEFSHKTSGRGIRPRTRRRCGTCTPTATTVSEAAVPESRRTPGAGTAASGFTPCMSCTGHWQTSPAPGTSSCEVKPRRSSPRRRHG